MRLGCVSKVACLLSTIRSPHWLCPDRQIRDCGAALLRERTGTRLLMYDSEKIYSNRPRSCYLVLGSAHDSSVCYRTKFIIKMRYCVCRLVSTRFALYYLNFGDPTALVSSKWWWCTLTNTMRVSERQLQPFALPTATKTLCCTHGYDYRQG